VSSDATPRRFGWKSAAAVVVTVATGVAQVTGAIKNLRESIESIADLDPTGTISRIIPVWSPYTVKAAVPSVVPYGLAYSLDSQEGLHWFVIDVQNRSKEPLNVDVDFDLRAGSPPATIDKRVAAPLSVDPRGNMRRTINPRIDFQSHEFEDELKVELEWFARETRPDKTSILSQGFREVLVLPRDVVDWDLKDSANHPVPGDFLLAALAAWTLKPGDVALQRAEAIRGGDDVNAHPHDWFVRCYDHLFHGAAALRSSSTGRFDMHGRRKVRTSSQVLASGEADALEAALLIGALSNAVRMSDGIPRALVIDTTPDPERYLFAWSEAGTWHAVDLSQHDTAFNDNEKTATPVAAALLARADIRSASDETGVFLAPDRTSAVLQFAKAADHFSIHGLP
jgi:hypothetical protein